MTSALAALQPGAGQMPVTCVPEFALWQPNSLYKYPG